MSAPHDSGGADSRSNTGRGLTLDDILELRAYERVRVDYRARVMERKKHRRVALGSIMTIRNASDHTPLRLISTEVRAGWT